MIIEPLHTVTINGKPLRFFRSLNDNQLTDTAAQYGVSIACIPLAPDLPWCSLNDLTLCMGLPEDVRQDWLRGNALCRDSTITTRDGTTLDVVHCRTVASSVGIICAVPYCAAYGYVNAAFEDDLIDLEFASEFDDAGRRALDILTAGLSPDDLFRWMTVAYRRYDRGLYYRSLEQERVSA
jgi:hypothetical protein